MVFHAQLQVGVVAAAVVVIGFSELSAICVTGCTSVVVIVCNVQ